MSHTDSSKTEPGQPPADIFDRIDIAVFAIDGDRRVRYANVAASALLGRPRPEIIGAPLSALLPPGQSFLGAACQTALDSGDTTTTFGWDAFLGAWLGIRVYRVADGAEVHVRTIPASDPASSMFGGEEPAPAVPLDTVATPMQFVDAEGVVHFANQALLDLLGYPRDEYVGRPMAKVFLQPEQASALLHPLTGEGDQHDIEAELRRRDGTPLTVHITTGSRDTTESPGYIQCYIRDVTDRRAVEEREARLAALVESSDDAIISKRLDGIITSWNPGSERMYGYTAEEAVGKPITLIFPDDREDDFPQIMGRLARGQRIDHYETVRRTKDGRLLDISVSISPIRNSSGRIIGAATIARDITERRMLERKQREFLTMVAHDLRSPLTSIKGFAQLMQRREAYSPSGIAAILTQVEHMERLVGDVLDITRIDENRQELVITEVELTEIARDITDNARELHRSGGEIRLVAPEEPVVGWWDKGRLAQILDNLVTNAVKYAPEGDVTVAITPGADDVTIEVADEGPGIGAEHLPYIFERFYRTPGEQAMGRGVGLGLTITRGLVQAHGGTIEAESEPGKGATFRVTLPWAAPSRPAAGSPLP